MELPKIRATPVTQLSTTALAAILTGVGVAMLGLLVGLVVLLVRAVRNHRRLLADLEERGVGIAQSQKEAKRQSITKPRTVLRRNTILPFNAKSGWGTLTSVETIHPPEPPSIPPHYAPPKPAGFVSRPSRLSWPFTARRECRRAIHLRKIRVPILSTVIESPKPSPLVPVLRGSLGGDILSPRKSRSRLTSDQSLLQHHPAFRDTWQEENSDNDTAIHSEPLPRSLATKPVPKTELQVRPTRSKSVAEIPVGTTCRETSQFPRSGLQVRSASMCSLSRENMRSTSLCSLSAGKVPKALIPPLPLDINRVKSDIQRRSLLSRSSSQMTMYSFESVGGSILIPQSSPKLPRLTNVRVRTNTKPDWKNSMINRPRQHRDTPTVQRKNRHSRSPSKSSKTRFSSLIASTPGQSQAENLSSTLTNCPSKSSIDVKKTESVTMIRVVSPAHSLITVRSILTPRRKAGCNVTAYGSPGQRQKTTCILQDVSVNQGGPQRQLSQASTQASSTRSSNGNPFQWDPAPTSFGKSSALKGSPTARKGDRRQNYARISLVPTTLGPPSRSPSPSFMNNILEESPNATTTEERNIDGLGLTSNRSLPRPPSTSTFAPDIKMVATSTRASFTPSSPTLSMGNYEHGSVGSPLSFRTAPALLQLGNSRLSTGSDFNFSAFPSPCLGTESQHMVASPPPTFALSRPSSRHGEELRMPDASLGTSSPFDGFLPNGTERKFIADEYVPERPQLVYHTLSSSPAARNFSSLFSTIHEESSATSARKIDYEQLIKNSPRLSPKSLPQGLAQNKSAYNLPIMDTMIPEEYTLNTIDPSIISKNTFSVLSSGFKADTSMLNWPKDIGHSTLLMPTSPSPGFSKFDPLLEAVVPSSLPTQNQSHFSSSVPSPKRARQDQSGRDSYPSSKYTSPSSRYTSSAPSHSPCTPRPRHAVLPSTALVFTNMPVQSPALIGPRDEPSSPLCTSIQKLRRMNSDAEKGGRGERRYLRFGREANIALAGDESCMDEIEGCEDETATEGEVELDEEKGRMLVGDLLDDWEEEATALNLDDEQTTTPTRASSPAIYNSNQQQSTFRTPKSRLENPSADIEDHSSSIWEDGEAFWTATPPHPRNFTAKPKQHNVFLSSSPAFNKARSRKRDFEVAKDDMGSDAKYMEGNKKEDAEERGDGGKRGSRHRKRSLLAIKTPNLSNVKIQVIPPSGGSLRYMGSLYDQERFLI